ncbi:MAG: zinc-ribbon domain-containing protein [Holosporaceae bacterium]|nr:MAG: zinc-ribbon domain-containing protein [Holosporaceae bacterium]
MSACRAIANIKITVYKSMMSERTIHIVCPQCRSGFDVDAEAIGPNGRTLMCSECEHRWFYQHDAEAPALDEHTPSTEEEIPAPEPEVDTQEKPPIIEAATPEAEGGAIREKVSFFTTQMFLVPIILGLLFTVMFLQEMKWCASYRHLRNFTAHSASVHITLVPLDSTSQAGRWLRQVTLSQLQYQGVSSTHLSDYYHLPPFKLLCAGMASAKPFLGLIKSLTKIKEAMVLAP